MINFEIDKREIEKFNKSIKDLSKNLDDKALKKVFRKGAKPYVKAARAAAPKADKVVKRYSTAKVNKNIRAPKGSGTVVAKYEPGNLGRSIKNLPLRRAKRSVIVGPKKSRKPSGVFSGARTDGYYAGMVEGGTKHSRARPFLGPSWLANKKAVMSIIISELKRILK